MARGKLHGDLEVPDEYVAERARARQLLWKPLSRPMTVKYLKLVVLSLLVVCIDSRILVAKERSAEGLVKEALEIGEPAEALKILDRKRTTFSGRAYLDYRYQAYAMSERYDEALEDLAKLKAMEPENTHWLFQSASVLRLKKQNEKALRDLNKIVEIKKGRKDGDFGYVFYERASLLKSMGRKGEALKEYIQASRQKKGSYEALREGCYLAVELKKPEEAVYFVSKLINMAPEEEGLYLIRAKQYALQGKKDLALKDLRTALKLSPDQWKEIDRLRKEIEASAN